MQRITDKDEFLRSSDVAGAIIRYAEQRETNDIKWFFDECWADWQNGKVRVIFASYKSPEYKDCVLSVEANKRDGGEWEIRTVKHTAPQSGV